MKRFFFFFMCTMCATVCSFSQEHSLTDFVGSKAKVTLSSLTPFYGIITAVSNDSITFTAEEDIFRLRNSEDTEIVYRKGDTFSVKEIFILKVITWDGTVFGTNQGHLGQTKYVQTAKNAPQTDIGFTGYALKKTGTTFICIGAPIMAVGTVCWGIGYGVETKDISRLAKLSQVITAGNILFPIGASLTIGGIPLIHWGKKLEQRETNLDFTLNYYGNGLGLAMTF